MSSAPAIKTPFATLPPGLAPLAPGFHFDIPAARYHADNLAAFPSLSSSLAVELVNGAPKKARVKHPRLNEQHVAQEETDEMAFGSVVHELALGRGAGFDLWPGKSWQGNEAKTFKSGAIAAGKTPIKLTSYNRAVAVVDAARVQLREMDLSYVLDKGHSETVAIWKEGDHYARAMLDKWHPEENEVWDIKTTGTPAHPEQVSRHIASMNYDLRSEFYLRGVANLTGIPARRGGLSYFFLFIETTPPFLVAPCFLNDSFQIRGKRGVDRAMRAWATCMDSGEWPGYATGAVEVQAPGWVDFEIEETGITPSGAKVA